MPFRMLTLVVVALGLAEIAACAKKPEKPADALTPTETRAIAREAYIYGFPIVDNYRIQYSYFVNTKDPEYKAPWNTLYNTARVYTPEDKAIQTPNSDTPYSFFGADLRAEPLVISVPAIDPKRYYSIQFVDAYTHNFAYVGSRATGNGAGSYLLAGPDWNGAKPAGITGVIRSETQFAFAIIRTQLFNPADIEGVKKVQAGYRLQTLSQFLGQPAPAPAPVVDFMPPLTREAQKTSPDFFRLLNFALQYCPTHPSEKDLMARFAKLGIGANISFDAAKLSPDTKQAVEAGMADAWAELGKLEARMATGEVTSANLFGTRDFLNNNYLYRFAAAVKGIYGNSRDEAVYPAYVVDARGQPLDGSHRYALHFAPGDAPPARAFWSLTLYKMPESLLSENPLHRYLINSPMLPTLKKDKDGGITLYVQHASPGKSKESNWLPAPEGSFVMAMRIYWPEAAALDGTWKQPPLEKVE
jgi:hypothetical protein